MTPIETAAIAIGAIVAAAGLALAIIRRHEEHVVVRGTGDFDHAEHRAPKAATVEVETEAFDAELRRDSPRGPEHDPKPEPTPELPAADPPAASDARGKHVKPQGKVHGSLRHRREGSV